MAIPQTHLDESTRIQKLLDDITRPKSDKNPSNRSFVVDLGARNLLQEYINDLTCSILEEAAFLALHRGSSDIEATDINMILVKKIGIEVQGTPRVKHSFHKYKINTQGTLESSSITPITAEAPSSTKPSNIPATKRKHSDISNSAGDSI